VPSRTVDFLLIGGGIASSMCAQTLREQGAQGSILLVGRELDAPYHRPPITKGYLMGRESRSDVAIHAVDWYADNGVELLTRTSVLDLDLGERVARLSNKEEVRFGRALIATGAMVRRLNVEGSQLAGIHYLRALGNADAVRRDAADAENVVLVGGSYIACEAAASLTELGTRCTIVMLESTTFQFGFGEGAGRVFQDVLERHGVEFVGPDEVARFEGDGDGDDARVASVMTKGGRQLRADLVVAGVGALPDVTLARKAGLQIGEHGGVRASSRLETAVEGVYVAGDMCEYDSVIHGRPMRIEHEDVAAEHGRTVARNMLGADRAHDVVPYFFSDLSDWISLEYVGPASEWDQEITRGSPERHRFSHWYLKDGHLVAALAVGRPEDLEHARRLIRGGVHIGGHLPTITDVEADLASVGS
jgi:3-phenylpropionate/trans-cinnamate dioxygenase ferredoxin reductase component